MKELYILLAVTAAFILLFVLLRIFRPKDKYPYERRDLLTSNELEFYQVLYPIVCQHGWQLLMKMRLADIMAVRKGTEDYMAYFNKIKAKHTDFVFCDPDTLEILAGLELDDPSHERPERMERDEFVDNAYAAAGIPLIHVWNPIEPEELEQILLEVLPSFAEEYEDEPLAEDDDDELLKEASKEASGEAAQRKTEDGSLLDPSSEDASILEADCETAPAESSADH